MPLPRSVNDIPAPARVLKSKSFSLQQVIFLQEILALAGAACVLLIVAASSGKGEAAIYG
jgi:hypothetical protein